MPGIPATTQWSGYQQHVLFGGNHALADESYLRCTIGGKITVQHSGQFTKGKVVTKSGKKGRYAARMDLLARAEAKMHRVIPPEIARRDATRVASPMGPGMVGAGAAGVATARLRAYNKAVERARLSQHVYSIGPDGKPTTPPPPGWRLISDKEARKRFGVEPGLLRDEKSGYKAGIYESDFEKPRKIVIAYAGTEDKPDAITDVVQAEGIGTKQYDKAMDLSTAMAGQVGEDGYETTGHSLGGGLASAGSAVTGAEGTTLNPAGMHNDTPLRQKGVKQEQVNQRRSKVNAYRSAADPLNNVQNNPRKSKWVVRRLLGPVVGPIVTRKGTLPPAYGTQHEVEPAPEYVHRWNELFSRHPVDAAMQMALDGHGIGQMIESMEHQKEADMAVLEAYLRS